MKNHWFHLLLVCVSAVLAGCGGGEPVEYRGLPPVSENVADRSDALAQVWRSDPMRGVMLREADLDYYRNVRPALLVRLRLLRVNYVCIAVESAELFSGNLRRTLLDTITDLGGAGIRCGLVISPYRFQRSRPMPILLRLNGLDDPFEDVFTAALRVNRDLPENCRLTGVMVRVDVHRFNEANPNLPPGQLYRWRENDYGIGSDNDVMMRECFRKLAEWRERAKAHQLKFSVAIPAFYHERALAKDLSKGTVSDFLSVADAVVVLGYGNKPSSYQQSLRRAVDGTSGRRVCCGVVLSGHVSEASGALRRRDWDDFMRIFSAMHQTLSSMPGYCGMLLIPWQGIELLQER